MVYYETVRQHDHAPNVIYQYSNDGHSQYYRGENVGQPSNPRWSAGAGNQSYSDGNNGRNYRGYLSDNDQGHRNNYQHRHHNGYR